jgi:hypothetical protein
MGSATARAFELMGVQVRRADTAEVVAPTVKAALSMAFEGGTSMAVLLGQQLIGSKVFVK